jgi:hypothetical protein
MSEHGDALTFDVLVSPRSSRERLGPLVGDRVKVALTAPPVDGAANAALIALVAKAFAVPRSAVTIVRGETGRRKTVRVTGATQAALMSLLA